MFLISIQKISLPTLPWNTRNNLFLLPRHSQITLSISLYKNRWEVSDCFLKISKVLQDLYEKQSRTTEMVLWKGVRSNTHRVYECLASMYGCTQPRACSVHKGQKTALDILGLKL